MSANEYGNTHMDIWLFKKWNDSVEDSKSPISFSLSPRPSIFQWKTTKRKRTKCEKRRSICKFTIICFHTVSFHVDLFCEYANHCDHTYASSFSTAQKSG